MNKTDIKDFVWVCVVTLTGLLVVSHMDRVSALYHGQEAFQMGILLVIMPLAWSLVSLLIIVVMRKARRKKTKQLNKSEEIE